MRYRELKEPCRSAIMDGRCSGCNRLEEENFEGDKECRLYDKKKEYSQDWRIKKR